MTEMHPSSNPNQPTAARAGAHAAAHVKHVAEHVIHAVEHGVDEHVADFLAKHADRITIGGKKLSEIIKAVAPSVAATTSTKNPIAFARKVINTIFDKHPSLKQRLTHLKQHLRELRELATKPIPLPLEELLDRPKLSGLISTHLPKRTEAEAGVPQRTEVKLHSGPNLEEVNPLDHVSVIWKADLPKSLKFAARVIKELTPLLPEIEALARKHLIHAS